MSLVFSILILGVVGGYAIRKRKAVDALLILCNFPLILIAGTTGVSFLFSTLNLRALSVGELARTAPLVAILLSLAIVLRSSPLSPPTLDASTLRVLAIGLLSVGVWRLGFGVSGFPPSDNDALVHAFTLRRIGEMVGHTACLMPRDAVSDFGLRFVPCGAHLLHYMDFLGLFRTTTSSLNSIYLLGAFVLPLGVAAFLRELHPQNTRLHLVGAASSLVFLLLPYALNGTLPYLVGLAFVFPVVTVVVRQSAHGWKGLLLAGMCMCGLALVHPTAALLSLVGGAGLVKTRRRLTRVIVLVIGLGSLSLVLVPKNVRTGLLDGLRSGNVARHQPDTSFWQRLILGTEWTRPQPVLLVLALVGLILLWRSSLTALRAICVVWISLIAIYLAINAGNPAVRIASIPFYGNWYRVLGALELLSIIPVAFSVDALLGRVSKKQMVSVAAVLTLLGVVSVGTGYRIVSQAWSRQTTSGREVLDSIERIPRKLSGRVLNDPADGSAWAYSGSNLRLLGAVDRTPDSYYGMIVDGLARSDLRPVVCSVINNSRVELLMLSSGRFALGTQLVKAGVTAIPIFETRHLRIYPFTSAFRNDCARRSKSCIEENGDREWFDVLVQQRFNRPPRDVLCTR